MFGPADVAADVLAAAAEVPAAAAAAAADLLLYLRPQVRDDISGAIYTQITDVEVECDGILNYDRSTKLDAKHVAQMAKLNQGMVTGERWE
jgi:hypothetical protein